MVRAIVFQKKNMLDLAPATGNERLFADAMAAAIILLDDQQNMVWWNRLATPMLKLDLQQHTGASIFSVLADLNLMELSQAQSAIELAHPYEPDGWLSIRLQPYHDQQNILILEDITQAYRVQAMRQDFIANVSHELRTPLTVFRGYLEILENIEDIPADQVRDMLVQMTGQSARMERLVQDLLLLCRLETHDPDMDAHQAVGVGSLLRSICEDAQSLSGESHHEFELFVDDALTMLGHPEELRSAFSNLVFNAVHYTPANGKIIVRWYEDAAGKHVEIEDNGIGIAQKYIPRITQRFYRVDKSRAYRGRGGTGLGLAIVKHVLLRHDGELSIQSQLHKGSLFRCSFAKHATQEPRS